MATSWSVGPAPPSASATPALIAGAILIFVVEGLRPGHRTERAEAIGFGQAVAVGLAQCLALWPGFSRSAATILGGMAAGLERKAATEFSFFLAIPTLGAATVYSATPVSGLVHQVSYVPHGSTPLDTGADVDLTGEVSGVVILNQDNIGTAAYTLAPRQATHGVDGTATLCMMYGLGAHTGAGPEDGGFARTKSPAGTSSWRRIGSRNGISKNGFLPISYWPK